MGLLSSTTGREKVIGVINKYGIKISVLLYIIGIVWMTLLAHQEFNAKNYFSENQLLPGLVDTSFSHTHYIYELLQRLQEKCSKSDDKSSYVRSEVETEFDKLGFDVFTQRFSHPALSINGTNVYGIYRSPRASGVESIVLNVPYHGGCKSFASISMMIALGKYFRQQTFWAKDIIFLLTEHNVYGITSWLEGYFQDHSSDLIVENLEGHGGSIQAAIILDLPSKSFSHLDISTQGLNGMLPNLDLVHVIVRIASYESVPVKLEKQRNLFMRPTDYWGSLETLIKTMAGQATGLPSGNHGLFYKYRIEAYTLKGIESPSRHHAVDFESLGRFLEGIFRSINNLLEHIHQSFFMYLLPNTNRYISIGLYMPPLGCLAAPLLTSLLQTWIAVFKLDEKEAAKETSDKISLSVIVDGAIVMRIILAYISSTLLLVTFLLKDQWLQTTNVYNELCVYTVACFVSTVFLRLASGKFSKEQSKVFQLYIILHQATITVVASIINFSAAFLLTALYVPLVLCTNSNGRIKKMIQVLLLPFTCPPFLLFIVAVLSNISFEKDLNLEEMLTSSLTTWKNTITLLEDYHSIRLWTSNAIFMLVLPLWLSCASSLT